MLPGICRAPSACEREEKRSKAMQDIAQRGAEAIALEVHGRLNLRSGASRVQLLREQTAPVLREIAKLHGVAVGPVGEARLAKMTKRELLDELRPWFS